MPDIEIKRGYEVLPDNNVRFGIRITNNSDSAISDVEVILDYNESLFNLEGHKIQKLGTIPPTVPRTAKFILKPLGCIHKENIGSTVIYKDHMWKKHTEEMRSKEVHCVCPFLKEKSITRAVFLESSKNGYLEERGVNFDGITVDKLVEFLSHTCKNRLYKVDEFPIENGRILYLAGDAVGEKAYYLLTAVVKDYEGLTQVLLRANSDKKYGLNGFLNEIMDNLRHLFISASAREIGIIKKEQVINIIDSFVQRSNFSVSDGTPSVNVRDSFGLRAEIKADEERKKREGERLRKEREDQERLQRQRQEEAQAQREKEEQEPQRMEEEAERQTQEIESQRKAQEIEKRERKAKEERERQRKLEAQRKEKELQDKRVEEERLRRQRDEAGRIQREKGARTSKNKFFAVALVLSLLALGYWVLTPGSTNAPTIPSTPTPIDKSTPFPFPDPPVGQNTYTNSIGMEFEQIPAGEFDMGSPSNETGRNKDEGPVHHVKISNAFYLGKYEVTQKQWRDVMGTSPSNFKGDNLPVEQVSWDHVQDFIKKLNEKEGGGKYRLPTEAEWEYAARAGTTMRFSFGDNDSMLGDYAWYDANSGNKTHDVGQKKPNPWGLYDMYGNAWEWVHDSYQYSYSGVPNDGSAWNKNFTYAVSRGGAWSDGARYCRSAARNYFDFGSSTGFRLLRIS